eukprot:8664221-Pyramimonas_sp.AAC.1
MQPPGGKLSSTLHVEVTLLLNSLLGEGPEGQCKIGQAHVGPMPQDWHTLPNATALARSISG